MTKTITARRVQTVEAEVAVDLTRDASGFLDMLRYDQARVVDWTYGGPGPHHKYTVTLRAERFTPDRWGSFLLFLRDPITKEPIR